MQTEYNLSIRENKIPSLTVLGAGPGDPELITLKGIKTLATADVILYDALVNEELLKFARPDVPKIFVGKRKSQHELTQTQINNLIVQKAKESGHVIRLKGGDPFVFGRGSEEIDFAQSHGLITNYIPGISSSIAVPGIAGVPVTERGVSQSFWVITATNSKGELTDDIANAASSNATVVVLMGLGKLGQIAEIFGAKGKQNLPVAIIQNGSLPTQKVVSGTVSNIVNRALVHNIQAPAVIVLGEVAGKLNTQELSTVIKLSHEG